MQPRTLLYTSRHEQERWQGKFKHVTKSVGFSNFARPVKGNLGLKIRLACTTRNFLVGRRIELWNSTGLRRLKIIICISVSTIRTSQLRRNTQSWVHILYNKISILSNASCFVGCISRETLEITWGVKTVSAWARHGSLYLILMDGEKPPSMNIRCCFLLLWAVKTVFYEVTDSCSSSPIFLLFYFFPTFPNILSLYWFHLYLIVFFLL